MAGLTPSFGGMLAEAISVCLDDQSHASPTPMRVSGSVRRSAILEWKDATKQARRCYNDEQVATEHAAYGVAFLLAQELLGLQVLDKSRKSTGFDYWMGPIGSDDPPFQQMQRLEVSGIRKGSTAAVDARVRKKLRQVLKHRSTLPAIVMVVEFGGPSTKVSTR